MNNFLEAMKICLFITWPMVLVCGFITACAKAYVDIYYPEK